jgi:predicted RNA polymerase sigma factor
LQTAIIACHAQAEKAEATDWPRIAALYAHLAAVAPSSIVELNRAVAVGMAEGPEPGLKIADPLLHEPHSMPITCCQAFEATCFTSSAAMRRRGTRSKRRPRSQATGANMTC